jgi:hypothetical protein
MASFTGTWEVVSSPDFDEGYLRMEVVPYVILKQSSERVEGKYQVGLQTGSLDGWLESENFMLFWVCPVSTDCLPLSHSTSSQSNLFVL